MHSYGNNVRPNTDFITSFTLNGQETRHALALTVIDPKKEWGYRYEYDWVVGSLEAEHDDSYLYRLPFAAQERYPVLQGMNGGYSHKGLERYAVDFDMPDGSAVHAAREGIVVDIKDDQRNFDSTSRCTLPANYITMQHSDGTTGEYIHLQYKGVLVKPGQSIKRGQLIGRAGKTGCSNQPHLHFAVYKAVPGPDTQSLPIKYISKQGIVQAPRHGDLYEVAAPHGLKAFE